ncbi:hypothetical protein [Microvirga sp. VF16]|uniref:hypothetical protein n=1 Tax=Microvirga sp. VF16 TaxID=2807101 RepID=UPI00193D3C69|nr:hypothetical protein [Microvirga sp. VF16]QRM32721.1 hypothetical protein JO965_32145 [Microvirga sp. VF16]
MPDPTYPQLTDILEHRGYQIRLSLVGTEWMAFVARPKQRPTLMLAPDREAVIGMAHEWIEVQVPSAGEST